MAGISISGLVSSLDTASIIDQLMQVEANPQTLLQQRLSSTQSQATAYRAVNTRFDALRTAAEALTKDTAWTAAKATTSSTTASAVTSSTAATGSVTFTVDKVAKAHAVISDQKWSVAADKSASDVAYGTNSLTLTVGGATKTISLDRDGNGTATLAEAAAAINADTTLGLAATAVRTSPTEYRLQISATKTGAASQFSGTGFSTVTQASDAQISVGDTGAGYTMTSATNSFTGLVDGTTITVSKPETGVTLNVTKDPDAVAAKVQTLVNAANDLLSAISSYSDADSSSAILKGDSALRQLATQVLDVLSYAVGGDGSAAQVGLQLTRDGRYSFDKTAFVAKLSADPTVVQRMFTSTTTTAGPDLDLATTADNVTSPVGVAAKLAALAKSASDTTTGTLVMLAKSKDTLAGDLEDQVEAWDRRLEIRRASLTAQFTAMETALATLKSQGSWLSAQLGSLPSTSSS
ncbi:flagellar filament capping protein FliD [Geodermatophilus sp. SYSU D01105]